MPSGHFRMVLSKLGVAKRVPILNTGSQDHELKVRQTPSVSQLAQESLVDIRGVRHRQLLQAYDRRRFLANQRSVLNREFESHM